MTLRQVAVGAGLFAGLLGGVDRPVAAQTVDFLATETVRRPVVFGAPYSADGTTTITQTLGDGTRIQRTVPSKFYRDSEGRVRREQTVLGLGALNPASDGELIITIVDVMGVTYSLNPSTKIARRSAPAISTGFRIPIQAVKSGSGGVEITSGFRTPLPVQMEPASPPPPPPPQPLDPAGPPPPPPPPGLQSMGRIYPQPLETKQIDGLTANGRRMRQVIPAGAIGNDRPIEITSESWESTALQVLLMSHHHDPRTGTVEFRLTNIRRAEPPRELFIVPADYKIVDGPPPAPPARPLDPAGPPPPPPAPPR